VSYEWTNGVSITVSVANPVIELWVGTHILTLTVTDDESISDTDTVVYYFESIRSTSPVNEIFYHDRVKNKGHLNVRDTSAGTDLGINSIIIFHCVLFQIAI
jgi:hypothetical protein